MRYTFTACSVHALALLGLGAVISLILTAATQAGDQRTKEAVMLTSERASAFAKLALKGLRKEYPNKPGDVLNGYPDVKGPRAMHPAFYGCFDWHSSVHGHWMLVRLLRHFPE